MLEIVLQCLPYIIIRLLVNIVNGMYCILSDENPDELQNQMNDAVENGYVVDRFSYATGAGLFYALMIKGE
jgi:hypothetical protein